MKRVCESTKLTLLASARNQGSAIKFSETSIIESLHRFFRHHLAVLSCLSTLMRADWASRGGLDHAEASGGQGDIDL